MRGYYWSMESSNDYRNTIAYEAKDYRVTRLMPGFEIYDKKTKRTTDCPSWTTAVAHIRVEREARRAVRRS